MVAGEKVVIDCSYLIPLFLEDELSDDIEKLVARIFSGEIEFISHLFLDYEVSNVLLTSLKRNRIKDSAIRQAYSFLSDIPRKNVNLSSSQHLTILDIALKYNLSFYDASYLFIAEFERAQLATHDKQLLKAALAAGVTLLK